MQNKFINRARNKKNIFLLGIFFMFAIVLIPSVSEASMLLPKDIGTGATGEINTCGELISGEYTLTSNVTAEGTSSCFIISGDNVKINGGAFTISGTGEVAIDARVRDVVATSSLVKGANGYTNIIINDLNITGFTVGINASGNSDDGVIGVDESPRSGNGGTGGDVLISYSSIGSIFTNGGDSTTASAGAGGSLYVLDTDLDISNRTISLLGGTGTNGKEPDGGLTLKYTGALTKTNLTLSSLNFFNIFISNDTQTPTTSFGIYAGGTWPILPGAVSSCGTLLGPGIFTLSGNVTSTSSTCFLISSNNVTIDGVGHSVIASDASTTAYAIVAGNYDSTTIASTTVLGFVKYINSSSSVTISGGNVDLSNKYIKADTLTVLAGTLDVTNTIFAVRILNLNYGASITGDSTATTEGPTSLKINNFDYGLKNTESLVTNGWVARSSVKNWYSITSSLDGKKLAAVEYGGYIYTSTDSGLTWASNNNSSGSHNWSSITSDASGTKLAATEFSGYVYTSTDSGLTWSSHNNNNNSSPKSWTSITSSIDGTKLAAVEYGGYIYTSMDSGLTWSSRASDYPTRDWVSITSSTDGSKLAAVESNGSLYFSADSGLTWSTNNESSGIRHWTSIASSADGLKLVAAGLEPVAGNYTGYIYTSTDSGLTWSTNNNSSGLHKWLSVTSDSSGAKLVAVEEDGYRYTSIDSGLTWSASSDFASSTRATLSSSLDGSKVVEAVYGKNIYTHTVVHPDFSINILTPNAGDNIQYWQSPYILWGSAQTCYYSYDNFLSSNSVNCLLNGSDILKPASAGDKTLYVRGVDNLGVVINRQVNFHYNNKDILINEPALSSEKSATIWFPNINYSISNKSLKSCSYSYNNFASTTSSDCSLNGSDILPPTSHGSSTLYIKTVDQNDNESLENVQFMYYFGYSTNISADFSYWNSVATSLDGTRIAAISAGLYIRISSDSGLTWKNIDGSNGTTNMNGRGWSKITESSDGQKLAVIENNNGSSENGYIWTSADYGQTWVKTSAGPRNWQSIAYDAQGDKIIASTNPTNINNDYLQYVGAGNGPYNSNGDYVGAYAYMNYLSYVGGGYGDFDSSGNYVGYGYYSSQLSYVGESGPYDYQGNYIGYGGIYSFVGLGAGGEYDSSGAYVGPDTGDYVYVPANYNYVDVWVPGGDYVMYGDYFAVGDYDYFSYSDYYGPSIFVSTDSGSSWTENNTLSSMDNYSGVALSSDGQFMSVTSSGGYIWTSNDYGSTWRPADGNSGGANSMSGSSWGQIALSSDGSIQVAVPMYGGYIYVSTDFGITWMMADGLNGTTDTSGHEWSSVTSDASGKEITAIDSLSGYIYSSHDFGHTWSADGGSSGKKNWQSIASSADGKKIIAGTNGGYIYILDKSSSYDPSLVIKNPISDSLVNSSSWTPSVFWGFRKTLCQYSYNYFASTTNADCSLGGSDILPPPTLNSNTLMVRTYDSSNNTNVVKAAFNYYISSVWTSRGSVGSWRSIATSADGKKLAALQNFSNLVYISTDSGITWSTAGPYKNWGYVTMSADGTKMAATTITDGYIYTSADSGLTWSSNKNSSGAGSNRWSGIASSADGTKLVASVDDGWIYTSTDSGLTWSTNENSSGDRRYWVGVSSSADGTKLAAVDARFDGRIWISSDAGLHWVLSNSSPSDYWTSIASSADGTKLVAAMRWGYIYTSTNSGVQWSSHAGSSGYRQWKSVVSSADGMNIAATATGGYIYISNDGGATWSLQESSRSWSGVSISADGTKFAALAEGTNILTYQRPSLVLAVDVLLPQASNSSVWNSIVSWGTAKSCYYSYNNFTSTSTANCSLLGSDILPPSTSGTSTLYIKGVDAGSTVKTNSVTFSYSPYYWCGTADSIWANPNNWYTSSSCSIRIGGIPGPKNTAMLVGSISPIISNSATPLPAVINSTGLTGAANTPGVVFSGNAFNTAKIVGNATFNSTSYNMGAVNGNAIFNAASAGAYNLTGSMKWGGTVSGSIKGSDGIDIIHLIFNNSSTNETTIENNISAVFNNAASNNGVINGNVTFNNNSPFRMGTVNGTSTLNGMSQTLNGINNVLNFFKQVVGSVRDTLYFASGSTLNVSGLTTILGGDANSLLTLRSTTPGSSANISLGASSTLNYLRIKDIHNTGVNVNVSSLTVYDDGGNSGITFPVNSSISQRGGITSSYTPPSIPVSHQPYIPPVVPPVVPPINNNPANANAGGGSMFFGNINATNVGKLNLGNIPTVNFGGIGNNFGVSTFVNPLADLLQLKPMGTFAPLPKLDWSINVDNFLNNSLPKSLVDLSGAVPSIRKELSSADIRSGYDLYSMKESPIDTPTLSDLAKDKTKQPESLIFISIDGKEKQTKLSIDKKGNTYQIITVEPYADLAVSVKNTDKVLPKTTFNGVTIKATKNKSNIISASVLAPKDNGIYSLKVGNLTLEVRVVRPVAVVTPKSATTTPTQLSPIQKLWSWFTK